MLRAGAHGYALPTPRPPGSVKETIQMGKHDDTGDRHRPDQPIPPDKKDDDNACGGGKRGK
ncbi:hypothetical protein GCM10023085_06330 [Actinomadura viridis]